MARHRSLKPPDTESEDVPGLAKTLLPTLARRLRYGSHTRYVFSLLQAKPYRCYTAERTHLSIALNGSRLYIVIDFLELDGPLVVGLLGGSTMPTESRVRKSACLRSSDRIWPQLEESEATEGAF